ncbi:hypothetical protein CDL12_00903 [Handroanthus impetiginosus]|uniref:Calcium uniporter protein C-terminal domain-containing protein n=1 Tax=Handroanthus impetiginosus TaxID=429701 RepID=A0A2G9I9B6_9LAMI|nr:hypothetical protein CDL12_00903 [Handroanthus impetiginosus]
MAFKGTLFQRLFSISRITNTALTNCRVSSPCAAAQSKLLNHQTTPNKLAPDPGDDGIFRRHLHRQSAAKSPKLRFLPTGEKLLEKLREMDIGRDRIRLDFLRPSQAAEEEKEMSPVGKITVRDAVKILRLSQLETVKSRLQKIENDYISHSHFLEIWLEIAKILDQSGIVIVLGNIVFLRPEQVVKAIQGLVPVPSPNSPDDPRTTELQEMEKQKAAIDKKAEWLVRSELWCGLGFLIFQTAAFMRLTLWELSWDVMEPICFYVTSIYFMGGYAFFLRTSKEPCFEGFFQSRFSSKQKRLMKAQKFDVERYNELKKALA